MRLTGGFWGSVGCLWLLVRWCWQPLTLVKSVGLDVRIVSSWISSSLSCTPHLDGVCHGSELLCELNRISII